MGASRSWKKLLGTPRQRAYACGLLLAAVTSSALAFGAHGAWLAKGPMASGHETLECASCHDEAPGSFRQQIQANLYFALGQREAGAFVGHIPVGNTVCLDCHQRPDDRHPTFRFLEPRFAEAREELAPHLCVSCHREHRGARVTVTPTFCSNCHGELEMTDDPIDLSHRELARTEAWDTCLGCHDFHGNHVRETPTSFDSRLPAEGVSSYFRGERSPYGPRAHEARRARQ